MTLAPAARPCGTCPYRRDCPSGLWAADEYTKLASYDGDVPDQVEAGAWGLFSCHTRPAELCAGWVGCHDMENNLAVRMYRGDLDPSVFTYVSPVPLWSSGAEAAAHGMRDIAAPGPRAEREIGRLIRRARRAIHGEETHHGGHIPPDHPSGDGEHR